MQTFHTKRRVAFSPLQMFDLVARVEDYPKFLPLCESLSLRSREVQADGAEIVIAQMSVGYGPINEIFTTKVTLERDKLKVLVEYLDGPFSHLENRWRFESVAHPGRRAGAVTGGEDAAAAAAGAMPVGGAGQGQAGARQEPRQGARHVACQGDCIVDFYLAYEFRSRMLQMLMGAMFDTAFAKFADAFEARAGVVYGNHRAAGAAD